MKPSLAAAALLAIAGLAHAGLAHAGQQCEDQPLTAEDMTKGMTLAHRTQEALDASGAEVVLLARAGQDLSEYGLRWSHLGLAYKTKLPDGGSTWRVVHKLNHCGTAGADIYRQGLGEFFLDRPYRYEGAFAVLSPQMQKALLPLLSNDSRAVAMHHPRYNMLAYPWALDYQQSNQFVTETLAAAAAPGEVFGRLQAQQWLQRNSYEPTNLHLSAAQRLGARVSMANVAFDDHPTLSRATRNIRTTTADSVFAWAARRNLTAAPQFVN